MEVAVIGTGNVGMAIAADLSSRRQNVFLLKSSQSKSVAYKRLLANGNRIFLKENQAYTETKIQHVSEELSKVASAEVVIITIQSTYHESLIKRLSKYLNHGQIVICICSYGSSFYFNKYCHPCPNVVETTGPYLEGRIELEDKPNEVVFRVGCRLTRSPLSVYAPTGSVTEIMETIKTLYDGFCDDYSVIECALLNPNMVLHTVGSIMSIPRIEYSKGDFCMYREAYARGNDATLNIMLQLDKEKQSVLDRLGGRPIDIFVAGGFLGDPIESFYEYSESDDRAISPTSVMSRYITEDVSQGLVLLESIANRIGIKVPVATALIDIANAALKTDFRANGRTVERLNAENYIDLLIK